MKNLSSRTPASNEILYTSADGNIVKPKRPKVFGANIVSNTYKNGQGVIVFDAPVTEIGDRAFAYCSSLTSVTIGNGVTKIGQSAFSICSSLTSVTIPDSVTYIGGGAFAYCSSLTSFYGKFASSDNRCLIVDGVLVAFAPANLTSYTIPDSVTEIGSCAFEGCDSLTSITIPDSVTEIGEDAFTWCSSLTSVTVPDSVTELGDLAFHFCHSLTSVYCKPTTPPAGGSYMFGFNASGRKIYVPRNSVGSYKSAGYWSNYASDIVGYDFE